MTSGPRGIGLFKPRLAVLICIAVFVAAPSVAAAEPDPGGAEGGGQVVQWGGRAFTTDGGLARWLRARGANYDSWATAHLRAAAILEGRAAPDREPIRGAPTWTGFNLPEGTALSERVSETFRVAPTDRLEPARTPITVNPSSAARAPISESPPALGGLALVVLTTGGLFALLLFVVAGVTGVPSVMDRTPDLIVNHRFQVAIVGIEILVFCGFIFMITVWLL